MTDASGIKTQGLRDSGTQGLRDIESGASKFLYQRVHFLPRLRRSLMIVCGLGDVIRQCRVVGGVNAVDVEAHAGQVRDHVRPG
jgi:hypothetical protein